MKIVSSLLLFVLGVSLTLWNVSALACRLSGKESPWISGELLSEDYQQSREFRQYVSRRLQDFVSIAVNGCPSGWWYGDSDSAGALNREAAAVQAEQELSDDGRGYGWQVWGQEPERLSEEEKELLAERKRQLTGAFFEELEGDKNLLYNIWYDGKLLHENGCLLASSGKFNVPEGYDFLLYFNGVTVRIIKDGEEVDVYGDGYYRGEGDWYVPGYRNLSAGDEVKQAVVCMAVAKEPVLYVTGDKRSGYRQLTNALYWMRERVLSERRLILRNLAGFALGLGLLFLSCFCRKGRREAFGRLAALQGRMWVEGKVLLAAALLFSLRCVPAWFWVALFWTVYLIGNDWKHNGKVWRQGLIAGCCRAFSARELQQPLARRMAHRNAFLFSALVFCGILILAGMVWQAPALCLAAVGCLLPAAWLVGKKNVRAAGEVDALAERIGEICRGNYAGSTKCRKPAEEAIPADGELAAVMAELENVRQGLADAVEEQMKSERMKVELIANVSHDLKTPLTSIISYVQFLKEEEGLPEHVKDYVRILDEKSQRLKNMVQDVFAVSKAASGELPVHAEELDFGMLLRQILADMDEDIRDSKVSFRTELPEEPVMIKADGQRMYRVFQNLFQNALKYSLDGSRVYVALKKDGNTAVASVKNASHMELKEGKDFTERFVRGDRSRADGGSGLGLSIAKSFTEACGGRFELEFNADLFIAKVSFQLSIV